MSAGFLASVYLPRTVEAAAPGVVWLRPEHPSRGWWGYFALLALAPILGAVLGLLSGSTLTAPSSDWRLGAFLVTALLIALAIVGMLPRVPKPATVGLASDGVLVEFWQGRRLRGRGGFRWPSMQLRGHHLRLLRPSGRLWTVVRLDERQLAGFRSFLVRTGVRLP